MQVGCGAVGLDFLATVAAFPQPDQKIRSTSFKVTYLLSFSIRSTYELKIVIIGL
jgi:hypothetical protein